MTPNVEHYEGTVFENRVPWVDVGTVVADDETDEALSEALDNADGVAISEMGTATSGELFEVTEGLRQEAAELGAPIAEETTHIVRWTVPSQESTTLHALDAREARTLADRCLSLLLDRLAASEDETTQRNVAALLHTEWNRRNGG